jgi:hypothetical protein
MRLANPKNSEEAILEQSFWHGAFYLLSMLVLLALNSIN